MSNLLIEVLSSTVTTVPTAKGSYQVCELAFKNKSFQDKVEGKKIMSFAEKEAFAKLSTASMGSIFTVTRIKDDKGYWKWQAVSAGDTGGSGSTESKPAQASFSGANTSPKSNYETADERQARQVMIVRQSSISNAIALLKTEKTIPTTADVLMVAKIFEEFVLSKEQAPVNTATGDSFLEDDIPL